MSSSVAARWRDRHKQRHAWAFRAYETFMASLSPEIRERLAHKKAEDEAYVVVFGRTQVGKTTLVMDLMGVSPSAMPRVSKVLRGGRPEGQSATATVIEYRRSSDALWSLRTDGTIHRFERDGDMTEALGSLRQAMQEHRLNLSQPCVVQIPQDCFVSNNKQPHMRMLDLPGDAPANDIEQAYALEMARRYVPLADLILLVGRGDDLSFLQPGALTLPGIEDWQTVPARFRIVTTYSFTAQSVRELVLSHGDDLHSDVFRERLIEQIEKFGPLSPLARKARYFFPLEFGRSWAGEKERGSTLYERVSPLMDALKRQLYADILPSMTPLARLKGAVLAHGVVSRVKEMHLQQLDEALKVLHEKLNRAREDEAKAQKIVGKVTAGIQALQARLAHLETANLKDDLEHRFELEGTTDLGDAKERVSGYLSLIVEAKASLRSRLALSRPWGTQASTSPDNEHDNAVKARSRFWRRLQVSNETETQQLILRDAFASMETHLKQYRVDKYWRTTGPDSNYLKDKSRLKKCLREAEERLLTAAREWWWKAAQHDLATQQSDLKSKQGCIAQWREVARTLCNNMEFCAEQCHRAQLERLEFVRRMDKDLAESRRFNQLLDTAYLAELKRRRTALACSGNAVFRFIDLVGAVHLVDARHELARITEDG